MRDKDDDDDDSFVQIDTQKLCIVILFRSKVRETGCHQMTVLLPYPECETPSNVTIDSRVMKKLKNLPLQKIQNFGLKGQR